LSRVILIRFPWPEDTTEAVAERPASATINEWYTSSEVRSMVWSDLASETARGGLAIKVAICES
jgi:hypothetical protein